MAAEYMTFGVELEPPKNPEDYNSANLDLRVTKCVDGKIKQLQHDGWKLCGSPWVLNNRIYLTVRKEK